MNKITELIFWGLSLLLLSENSFLVASFDQIECWSQLLEYSGKEHYWRDANGIWCSLGKGSYLTFITIKNNSKDSIVLMGDASISGNIIPKDAIEKERFDIASKQVTKVRYVRSPKVKNGDPISVAIACGIMVFPVSVVLQLADFMDRDRNLIRLSLQTTLISAIFFSCLSLFAPVKKYSEADKERDFNKEKEISQNDRIGLLFDECDVNTSWLEAPTMTIAPNQTVVFSLIVFGKHEITVFDSKSYRPLCSFSCGLR